VGVGIAGINGTINGTVGSTDNSRRILEKYRDRICTFNDDMQGTGAITLAAGISAVRICGTPLRNQRVAIYGAGTAGIGVAGQIRDAIDIFERVNPKSDRYPLAMYRAGQDYAALYGMEKRKPCFRPSTIPETGWGMRR